MHQLPKPENDLIACLMQAGSSLSHHLELSHRGLGPCLVHGAHVAGRAHARPGSLLQASAGRAGEASQRQDHCILVSTCRGLQQRNGRVMRVSQPQNARMHVHSSCSSTGYLPLSRVGRDGVEHLRPIQASKIRTQPDMEDPHTKGWHTGPQPVRPPWGPSHLPTGDGLVARS